MTKASGSGAVPGEGDSVGRDLVGATSLGVSVATTVRVTDLPLVGRCSGTLVVMVMMPSFSEAVVVTLSKVAETEVPPRAFTVTVPPPGSGMVAVVAAFTSPAAFTTASATRTAPGLSALTDMANNVLLSSVTVMSPPRSLICTRGSGIVA